MRGKRKRGDMGEGSQEGMQLNRCTGEIGEAWHWGESELGYRYACENMLGDTCEYTLGDAGVKPCKRVLSAESGENPGKRLSWGERSMAEGNASRGVSGSK